MEREVRHTKNELIGLKQGIDTCTDPDLKANLQEKYDQKAKRLEAQNLTYNNFCKENDLKSYEDRLSVARWDREQARASIAAARAGATSNEPEQISIDSYMKQVKVQPADEPFEDVTEEWYATATPNSHEVLDLQEWTVDGVTYKVREGSRDVVLDYKPHEKEIAELLEREFGGEICMVPRVNNPQGIRTPDYLFRGKKYDLKTLEKEAGENTIYHRVDKSHGQADHIIVDITKGKVSENLLSSQISKIFSEDETSFVKELWIISDGVVKKILQKK